MRTKTKQIVGAVAGLALALGIGLGFTGGSSGADETPPRPPWVNPDGSYNMEKARTTKIKVIGQDGKIKKDKNGNDIEVTVAPPPPPAP